LNFFLWNFLQVLEAKTSFGVSIDILPDILLLYYARAASTTVAKIHNKPQFVKGRPKE
jgi:hypothetical protein